MRNLRWTAGRSRSALLVAATVLAVASTAPCRSQTAPATPAREEPGILDSVLEWFNGIGREYQTDVVKRLSVPTRSFTNVPASFTRIA